MILTSGSENQTIRDNGRRGSARSRENLPGVHTHGRKANIAIEALKHESASLPIIALAGAYRVASVASAPTRTNIRRPAMMVRTSFLGVGSLGPWSPSVGRQINMADRGAIGRRKGGPFPLVVRHGLQSRMGLKEGETRMKVQILPVSQTLSGQAGGTVENVLAVIPIASIKGQQGKTYMSVRIRPCLSDF